MEKCTKAGYNEFIVKEKCLNGQNYFLNGRIQNMRMTKKVTAMALASMMALSLAGCGGSSSTTATTAAATEAAKETTAAATELVRYLTEDLGFKAENVVVQDGKGDQAEQTNQIQNFITQKYDVLILNLVQASSAPEITDMCKEAGIPVVYINREPDAAEEERWESEGLNATYVGCDARQSGTYQGEEILETANKGDINGDGKVSYIMIQGDPENVDAQYRTEFSVKALTDAGMEVEELLKQRGDWDQARAQQIAQDALNQYGDKIEVIFCNNDAMALGALQAIEAAGRKVNEDIYLVGVDALTEAVQNVIDGKQTGTVFNNHFAQAQAASDIAVKFLSGEKVDAVNMVNYEKVTQDNAQEILDMLK